MSGLNNLNKRLQYRGGDTEGRLIRDKAKTLKNAQYNSYQAATVILPDDREFKCLINPDKLNPDYDNKIISIPFEDVCLNPEVGNVPMDNSRPQTIGVTPGMVLTWKENNTHWIVFLQNLEEKAYFRGDIRLCKEQVEINNQKYWVYVRGPKETAITWNQKGGVEWNDLNYSQVMYITKDSNTVDYFHRFKKIKITEGDSGVKHTWQVVSKNIYYGDGIIQVCLDEYYENPIEDAAKEEQLPPDVPPIDTSIPYIKGPSIVKKYDTVTFSAEKFTNNGQWILIENAKEKIISKNTREITLDIVRAKGTFIIKYKTETEEAFLEVKMTS